MLTERGQNKLKAEHKRVVKQMLALGESCKDIVDHLKLEHEISVHHQTVYWYSWKYQDEIKQIRSALNVKFEAIPVANKFNRVLERQALIDDLKNNLWLEVAVIKEGKVKLNEDGSPVVVKVRGRHDVINRVLDSIQKEMEPLEIKRSGEIEIEKKEEYKFVVETIKKLKPGIRREIISRLEAAESYGEKD